MAEESRSIPVSSLEEPIADWTWRGRGFCQFSDYDLFVNKFLEHSQINLFYSLLVHSDDQLYMTSHYKWSYSAMIAY